MGFGLHVSVNPRWGTPRRAGRRVSVNPISLRLAILKCVGVQVAMGEKVGLRVSKPKMGGAPQSRMCPNMLV